VSVRSTPVLVSYVSSDEPGDFMAFDPANGILPRSNVDGAPTEHARAHVDHPRRSSGPGDHGTVPICALVRARNQPFQCSG
jgi:hypothetical protein